MPRRNYYILFIVTILGMACAIQSDRDGRLLTYAMRQIDQRHLERVDREDLFEGAMQGMVSRFKEHYADEYTIYVPPDTAPLFNEELDQQFGGVGMHVMRSEKTGQLTVVCPLIDTPAYRAGILAGDVILKIDGQATEGMSSTDAVKLMRGEVGQPVTLTVLHKGGKQPVDMTIERAVIKVDTVLGDRRKKDGKWDFFLEGEDRIGYVRISTITDGTNEELRKAINGLIDQGMQGLILDLRFNSGGYLGESIAICDMFVDGSRYNGMIVSTKGRDGKPGHEFHATAGNKYGGFPIVVLINKYSASAAEIIAACLQDHRCAVIMGQRSYGKGTVQEVLYLDANQGNRRGLIKVTSSSYWRPSEVNINRGKGAKEEDDWGVRPDKGYEVIVKDEDLSRLVQSRRLREMGLDASEVAKPKDPEKTESEAKSKDEKPGPVIERSEKASEDGKASEDAEKTSQKASSEKKTPDDDDGTFFDPQLDVAVEYLREQIAEQQRDR